MQTFTNLIEWFFDARMLMLNHQIPFLKEQNLTLREHLPKSHLVFTERQKQRLFRFDKLLGCKAKELLTVIHTTAWYRWKREQNNRDIPKTSFRIGRPPKITNEIRKIVYQMVKANYLWGYPRIMAELKKIGISLSAGSIRNILKEEGSPHLPRHSEGSWDNYLKRTFHTLWACDFFTKTILTPVGLRYYFVIFFINIKTRQVHIAGISRKPDNKWILNRIKNMNVKFNPSNRDSVLIRDQDGKFNSDFDDFLKIRESQLSRPPSVLRTLIPTQKAGLPPLKGNV